MHDCHFEFGLGEAFEYFFVTYLEVIEVHFFALENERIHHEHLAAERYLLCHELVHGGLFGVGDEHGFHGFAAGRQFVDNGDVQVAVNGHCQGAGDGGSGHHQHVRRAALRPLGPEFCPLVHAEAVLFVNHCKAKGLEDDVVFDECVCADDDAEAAVFEPCVYAAALLLRRAAGQQGAAYAGAGKISADVCKMLLCKHFRGRHYAGLVAVVHRQQRTQHCHHRLAGAYVALEQAVHLVAAAHVFEDLPDHTFLGAGEGEGERSVEGVEGCADLRHRQAGIAVAADEFLFEQAQLQKEQFFELEATGSLLQGVLVGREVDVAECVLKTAEGVFGEYVFRQRFADFRQAEGQGGALQFAHHFAGDSAVYEFFGAGINAREAALQVGAFRLGKVHLRVHHIELSVEQRWLAEEHEHAFRNEPRPVPFDAFEEHHFHLAGAVLHYNAEALYGVLEFFVPGRNYAAAGAKEGAAHHTGFYLDVGLFAGDFRDAVEAAAVDVAVRVDAEKLSHGAAAQLRLDESRSFRPHPGDVLYVAVQVLHGIKIVIFRQKTNGV